MEIEKQVTISCSICRYFCRSFACEDQVLYGLAFELLMFSQSYHRIQHCPNTLSFVSTIQVDCPREVLHVQTMSFIWRWYIETDNNPINHHSYSYKSNWSLIIWMVSKGLKSDIIQITLRSELFSQIRGLDIVLRDRIHKDSRITQ